MTSAEARQRIAELRAQVARHDELYYRQARPEITDFEYDRLKRELADLEAQFPQFKAADSPTQAGGRRSAGGIRHLPPPPADAEPRQYLFRGGPARLPPAAGEALRPRGSRLRRRAEDRRHRGEPHLREGRVRARRHPRDGVEGDDITANAKTIRRSRRN